MHPLKMMSAHVREDFGWLIPFFVIVGFVCDRWKFLLTTASVVMFITAVRLGWFAT